MVPRVRASSAGRGPAKLVGTRRRPDRLCRATEHDDPINPQPAPTGAAPPPDSAPASRGRLGRWFGFQVDNKPWWIVVLVAGLGAVGAGIVAEVPSVVSWVSSFFSTTKIFILVTDENSGGPLDDVVVYFQNMETLERVHLLGSEQNDTVKTRGGGNAYVKMHVSDDGGHSTDDIFPFCIVNDLPNNAPFPWHP